MTKPRVTDRRSYRIPGLTRHTNPLRKVALNASKLQVRQNRERQNLPGVPGGLDAFPE